MAIDFDPSRRSVLAACDCCAWIEIVTSMDIARRIALDHLWKVHPEQLDAINVQHVAQHRARVAAVEA